MNQMTREKAIQYAKYRWHYSTDDCQFIIETANVSQGVVADIAAGTGLLTQHFEVTIPIRYLFKQEQSETWDDYWGAIGAGMESPDESGSSLFRKHIDNVLTI